jgi:hypothetical protein
MLGGIGKRVKRLGPSNAWASAWNGIASARDKIRAQTFPNSSGNKDPRAPLPFRFGADPPERGRAWLQPCRNRLHLDERAPRAQLLGGPPLRFGKDRVARLCGLWREGMASAMPQPAPPRRTRPSGATAQVADPFLPMKRHSTLRVPYPFAFCAKGWAGPHTVRLRSSSTARCPRFASRCWTLTWVTALLYFRLE